MAVVNDRVAKARASLPVIEVPQEPAAENVSEKWDSIYSENTAKSVMRKIRSHPGITGYTIAEDSQITPTTVNGILKCLYEMGCLSRVRVGKAFAYTFVKLPTFWTEEDVDNAVFMPSTRSTSKQKPLVENPTDNAFSELLSRTKVISYENIGPYEQLIKDLSKFYGVKEIDDLVKQIVDACIMRINSATARCVICDKKLVREGSGVFCPNCQISLNLGSAAASLKAYMELAPELKGMKA